MPGIVPDHHWTERECARIREEIQGRHRDALGHADPAIREQARTAIERETSEAIQAYKKSRPGRIFPNGPLLR